MLAYRTYKVVGSDKVDQLRVVRMNNNIIVLPIIIPIIAGMVMFNFRNKIKLHRFLSIAAILSIGFVSVVLMEQVKAEGIQTLYLGGWEAPFGITLVADMFALLLVLVTAIVYLCCIYYAFSSIGPEEKNITFIL